MEVTVETALCTDDDISGGSGVVVNTDFHSLPDFIQDEIESRIGGIINSIDERIELIEEDKQKLEGFLDEV